MDLACKVPNISRGSALSRRGFLDGITTGLAGLFCTGSATTSETAQQSHAAPKRVCVIFLQGGASQLEMWDPKPATDSGGPFRAIPTSVTGTHISELLPRTAMQVHQIAIVRGLNTAENDHERAHHLMLTGHRPRPGFPSPQRSEPLPAVRAPIDARFAEGNRRVPRHPQRLEAEPKVVERYGQHRFGQDLLQARLLLEEGVNFVEVAHSSYDGHFENFDLHMQRLGEFDRSFTAFLDELTERGLFKTTLVVVLSEFGRTPKINHRLGRDHWSQAWSIALAGAGILGGAVVGKTNASGTAVIDRQINAGELWQTCRRALGFDTTAEFGPDIHPVNELLE